MTFKEATAARDKYMRLIGKKIAGRKIDNIVIAPMDGQLLTQILGNDKRGKANDYIYSRYNAFEVMVIYESTMSSNILSVDKDPLPAVLAKAR